MSIPIAIASNVYYIKQNIDKFVSEENEENRNFIFLIQPRITLPIILWSILNLIISMFAIYLAFKCIKKGKNKFLHLFTAFFFSIVYIPYYYGTQACK